MPGLRKLKSMFKLQRQSYAAPPPLSSISDAEEPAAPAFQQQSQHQRQDVHQRPVDPTLLISAENIRELRELIRYRYALDIEIWRQRRVKSFKRGKLQENMRRSDAALVAIKKTLLEWDRREYFTSDVEHQKFKEIKSRLMGGVKAHWEKNPPWEFVNIGGDPHLGPYEMYGQPVTLPVRPTNGTQRPFAEAPSPMASGGRVASGTQRPMTQTQRPISGQQWRGQPSWDRT